MFSVAKVVPDTTYNGPLTNWGQECQLLWQYLQFPADAFSLHIAASYKFAQPLRVASANQRMRKFLWCPDVALDFRGKQVFSTSDDRVALDFADLQRVLGVGDEQWTEFLQQPLCISLPFQAVRLAERAAWSKILLRVSWGSRKNPEIEWLMERMQFPTQEWLQELRRLGRHGGFAPPPKLPFHREHAQIAAKKLRQNAQAILTNLADEDERSAKAFELEHLVCRLDAFAEGMQASGNHGKALKFDADTLVASLSAAMQLRDRASLRATVQGVFQKFSLLAKWTLLLGAGYPLRVCFRALSCYLTLLTVVSCGIVSQSCMVPCIC